MVFINISSSLTVATATPKAFYTERFIKTKPIAARFK
jgi:hypothetical protein